MLVTAFVLLIPMSALFFIPKFIETIPNEQMKFYLYFGLNSCTYFISAFVAFSILRQMFFRVGLDNSAAVGKAFQTREKYLSENGKKIATRRTDDLENSEGRQLESGPDSMRTVELGEI